MIRILLLALGLALWVGVLLAALSGGGADYELLHVSYDPTRELYRHLNRAFREDYLDKHGKTVTIRQSHGGSGSQARAVLDGIPADVVSLAMWMDVDSLATKRPLLPKDWMNKLPNRSLPYTSTIVFVVKKGNPKGILDWKDLVEKSDVEIVTANPKTGGGAKLSLLGGWGAVFLKEGEEAADEFVREMYQRVPVLDTGARGATITFARRGIGDVHLTWENEAIWEVRELPDELEIVYPKSGSILAEPHVALVEANVLERGTSEVAKAYLEFLYTASAQQIIAQNGYRPSDESVRKNYSDQFQELRLFTIEDLGLTWVTANDRFFADGGLFDRVYQKKP